jgi:hypothetical protein
MAVAMKITVFWDVIPLSYWCKGNKKFSEELIACLSLICQGPHRKWKLFNELLQRQGDKQTDPQTLPLI